MDYIFNRSTQSSPQVIQMPQFNITTGENNNNNNINNNHHHHQQQQPPQHQFSFLQDSFVPATTGGGECYNLNFAMTSSSATGGGVIAPGGFSRGTLQSNLQSSSLLPHHIQRFQSDGSTSTNLPFFMAVEHYPVTGVTTEEMAVVDGGWIRKKSRRTESCINGLLIPILISGKFLQNISFLDMFIFAYGLIKVCI
ncbi:putative transcription factor, TCP [Helianthus annuus]|nr:putative transcription factor, TCP [Helianthus annuus]